MRRHAPILLAATFGVGFLAWSQFPHLWAGHAESLGHSGGKVYAGVLPTSAEDAFSYLGWMRQGAEGRFLLDDRYTVEEHPRVYVNAFYAPLGTVASIVGLSIPRAYALARVASGALLVFAAWWFAGLVFDRAGPRLACFALSLVSGGWEGPYNWFVRNRGWEPLSSPGWWTPEISTAFSTMTVPHFTAALALLLVATGLMILAWREGRGSLAAAAGVPLLLLAFFHPYEVVIFAATAALYPLGAAAVERRSPIRDLLLAAVPMAVVAPAIAWNAWVFSRNPALRAMDEQAVMTTPEISKLLLAFGAAGALALVALLAFRRMTPAQRVAASWLVGSLIASELPFRFQRRLLGGIQFPIAALAVVLLAGWVVPWIARLLGGRTLPAALGVALLLAPLEVATPHYVRDIDWKEMRRYRHPVWIVPSEHELLRAIERVAADGDAVFCSYDLGMLVPATTRARVYLGHYSLTIDSERKRGEVERFFRGEPKDDGWRRDLLARAGIDLLAWTAHERALGPFDPATAPWLVEVARAGEGEELSVLYRVGSPASTSPNP